MVRFREATIVQEAALNRCLYGFLFLFIPILWRSLPPSLDSLSQFPFVVVWMILFMSSFGEIFMPIDKPNLSPGEARVPNVWFLKKVLQLPLEVLKACADRRRAIPRVNRFIWLILGVCSMVLVGVMAVLTSPLLLAELLVYWKQSS